MPLQWKRVAFAGLATAAVVAVFLLRAGLENADKWASVLSLFVAISGLVVGILGLVLTYRQPTADATSAAAAFKALLNLTENELASRSERFDLDEIYSGPCLILNRHSGLALDSKIGTAARGHTTLWPAHAAPWQQWRIRRIGGDQVEIVSESTGLRLTTMRSGGDWTEVWLDDRSESEWSTSWRLRPTEDRSAFVIENAHSPHALDPGSKAEQHHSGDPHIWSTNWAPWQQWVITRLPLG